jgi:hypothetical protein
VSYEVESAEVRMAAKPSRVLVAIACSRGKRHGVIAQVVATTEGPLVVAAHDWTTPHRLRMHSGKLPDSTVPSDAWLLRHDDRPESIDVWCKTCSRPVTVRLAELDAPVAEAERDRKQGRVAV